MASKAHPLRGPAVMRGRGRYTVRRFLPLALLRLMTRRPPLVAMRTRNPWVLLRFRFVTAVRFFFMMTPRSISKRTHKPQSAVFVKNQMGIAGIERFVQRGRRFVQRRAVHRCPGGPERRWCDGPVPPGAKRGGNRAPPVPAAAPSRVKTFHIDDLRDSAGHRPSTSKRSGADADPVSAAGVRLFSGEIAPPGMDLSCNQGKRDRPWNKGGHRR